MLPRLTKLGGLAVAVGLAASAHTAMNTRLIVLEAASAQKTESGFAYEFPSPIEWKEIIPSWEVNPWNGEPIEVRVKVGQDERLWDFGRWSMEERTSVNDQKSDAFQLFTDTLVAAQTVPNQTPMRVEIKTTSTVPPRRLYLNFWGEAVREPSSPFDVALPIEPLDVPRRCQANYPGGNVLCSPTSVSMVLSYWAIQLKRPEIDHDVPLVQKHVHDPGWGGTGNWSFNTSFAATLPGMSGCVTRLRGLADLRAWLARGVPVVCSVSYDLLKGKETKGPNDGHLVVVVGIDPNGDILINDPGRQVVRLTYPRQAFLRAWESPKRTVYLIYPENWLEPVDPTGPWRQRS